MNDEIEETIEPEMLNLASIKARLTNAYERIVYPKAMGDMPIPLKKMIKYVDKDGNPTAYYSINELSRIFGNFFTPQKFTPDGSLMWVRWSFDKDLIGGVSDEEATKQLLLSYDLVDLLKDKEAKDIDISTLKGNEFGIFGTYEFKQIKR